MLWPLLMSTAVALAGPLERGLEAKAAGELPVAQRELARAVAEQPENAEAWFHYGTVLAWQKNYHEAEQALDRGLAIAPADYDLQLMRIRVWAWQGDWDRAATALTALERDHPGNEDLLVMKGRLAEWREQPDEAARIYDEVLAGNPQQMDALIGRGDVAAGKRRNAEARGYFAKALEVDPQSPEAKSRLEALDAIQSWRVDLGVTTSSFSGSSRSDWWSVWTQLSGPAGPGSWWLRGEHGERFSTTDTLLELGWEGLLTDGFGLRGWLGGSPDADWAARWLGETDLRFRPTAESPWFLGELRYAEYLSGEVWTSRLGIEQPFAEGWTVNARWVHQEFAGGEATEGGILTLEKDFGNQWIGRLGVAHGAESLTGQTVGRVGGVLRSTTVFGGLRGPMGSADRGWRVDVEFEDVSGGPNRLGMAFGIHQAF